MSGELNAAEGREERWTGPSSAYGFSVVQYTLDYSYTVELNGRVCQESGLGVREHARVNTFTRVRL